MTKASVDEKVAAKIAEEGVPLEWEKRGFHCVIVRHSHLDTLNGYVGLPPGHPWHGKDYNSEELTGLDVHGGLTYSESKVPSAFAEIKSRPAYWYIGFDTAHAGDYIPNPYMSSSFEGDAYRDLKYVKGEIYKLVKQAEEVIQ